MREREKKKVRSWCVFSESRLATLSLSLFFFSALAQEKKATAFSMDAAGCTQQTEKKRSPGAKCVWGILPSSSEERESKEGGGRQ